MIHINEYSIVVSDPMNNAEPVIIILDVILYPESENLILAIKELQFSDPKQAVKDIIRLKKLLWNLYYFVQGVLNIMSNRSQDYYNLEKAYYNIMQADIFICNIIQLLEEGIEVFQTHIENPFGRLSLNGNITLLESGYLSGFFYSCKTNKSV